MEKLVKDFRKENNGKSLDGLLKAKQIRKLATSNLGRHCDNRSFTDKAVGILKRSQFLIGEAGNEKWNQWYLLLNICVYKVAHLWLFDKGVTLLNQYIVDRSNCFSYSLLNIFEILILSTES